MQDDETPTSAESSTRSIDIRAIVGFILFLTAVLTLLALFSDIGRGKLIAYAIFFAVIIPLAVLSAKYRFVEETIERSYAAIITFLVWIILTLVPIVAFNWLAQFVIVRISPWIQGPVFILWALILAWAIRLIATDRSRERAFGGGSETPSASRFGIPQFTPFLYAFDLLVISVMFFSSITFVLVQNGAAELSGQAVTYDSLMTFYIWHFLEAIPLLKVNDTLQWKAPLTYQSRLVGFVLLLFKISVIIPVIAAFAWHWKRITTDTKPDVETGKIIRVPGAET